MGVTSALFKVYFLLFFLPDIIPTLGTTTIHRNVSISRDHVSIWFQPPLIQKESQYDKESLKEMISLVGSQFGTLLIKSAPEMLELVPPETVNDSLLLIPGLVAKYNEAHPNKKIKVIMSFTMSNDSHPSSSSDLKKNRIKSSLEVAKYVANEANSLYSGTVDTLLLIDNTLLPLKEGSRRYEAKSLSKIYEDVRDAGNILRNNTGPTSYKLGVVIPYEGLWMRGTVFDIDQFKSIFMNVDIFVPLIYFDEFYAKPEEEHHTLIQVFDDCERMVNEGENDVEMVPLISCKPPISRDSEDISKFLQCWNLMSDWAKKNNQSIIMYEAFDQYRNQGMTKWETINSLTRLTMHTAFTTDVPYFQSPLLDAGWWRLKSEMLSSVNNQTGAVKVNASCFIPKADEIFGMRLKIGERFSPKTAIYFDYHVRYLTHYQHYYDNEVREMLELVSTRFSSITIENKVDDFNVASSIPIIAAKLNRDNLNNSSFKPLTIIYSFLFDRRYPKELNEMLQDIDLANAIFPGTVHTFAIDYDKYKSRGERKRAQWEALKVALDLKYAGANTNSISYLQNFHATTTANPIHNNNSSIRLGLHVNLGDDMFLKDEPQPDIKLLDVIIVDISSSSSSNRFLSQHDYVDSILNYLFASWKDYREIIESKYPNAEVLLSVDCSQITSENPSIEPAAKCCDMVNQWANDNQVEIILHQAFEIPGKMVKSISQASPLEVGVGLGSWWTLKRMSEIHIRKISFVETFRDLMTPSSGGERVVSEEDKLGCKGDTSDNHVGLIVFFICLIVTCPLAIVCIVFWYSRKISTSSTRNEWSSEMQLM